MQLSAILFLSTCTYILYDNAYDHRKTKGTPTSSTRDVRYADRNGYMIRYNGYASTSRNIKFMSDILIEEMEDNTSYNRFPMNKPNTLNDYRIYFGKERFGQLLAQHFLRGHHKDTIDMTMEYEWLEVTGYIF